MAILHVRGVPDELHELLRKRAAAHHRSLSAEVIALLASRDRQRTTSAERMREGLEKLDAIRRRSNPGPKGYAADLIREMRGEIGPPGR